MRFRAASFAPAALVASLLVAAVACNSRPPAAAVSQRPLSLSATSQPTSAPTSAPASPAAVSMKRALSYLASDTLEGRGLGTEGLDLAAAYIAGDMHGAGLEPLAGFPEYFQRFEAATADGIAEETKLASGEKAYKLKEDFIPLSFSAEKAFEGQAVFVGYGITSKEHHYDDYANVDVKGKVAVAWRFEPIDKEGKSKFAKEDWSESAHLDMKVRNAADHGAVALILMNPPLFKTPEGLLPFAREFQGATAAIPLLQLKPEDAYALLGKGTGKDVKQLQEEIDAGPTPHSQALEGVSFSGKVAIKRTVRYLQNVISVLPGEGPHADEYVVVGAHYDHLGYGGSFSLSPKVRAVHNGADDNGSGTVAILEIARDLAQAKAHGHALPRSVIFVAFTGEEEGLWGSSRFVNHPPVPLDKIVAMLNLDMVGRIRKDTLFVGGGGTATAFEKILKRADEGSPLVLKDIGKGGFGPSDHMSFALKKIPVLFFFSGIHEDYHRPTDKVEKINFNGMADVVALSDRVVTALAEMPRQAYVTAADAHSMTPSNSPSNVGQGSPRAALGVVPDYTTAESDMKGVKISGASPGSPADKAGLKEGDVLIKFNERALDSLVDLSTALNASKPGDKVKIVLLRNNEKVTVEVTLGERK
jgi:hypothetical protein